MVGTSHTTSAAESKSLPFGIRLEVQEVDAVSWCLFLPRLVLAWDRVGVQYCVLACVCSLHYT